jgi:hypothetical protein
VDATRDAVGKRRPDLRRRRWTGLLLGAFLAFIFGGWPGLLAACLLVGIVGIVELGRSLR